MTASRSFTRGGLLAALLALPPAGLARPASDPYSYAHHGVSTAVAAAQAAFDRGLTLVYAYQQGEAEQAFRQAARLDPSLAMAWWGVALAEGANINVAPETRKVHEAQKAIARARRLAAGHASEAERDYIEALAARYTADEKPDFDALAQGYRDRMRGLHAKYPRDPDAAALLAESIMDLNPWRLWTADGQPVAGTLELVEVIETGLKANPEHLGLLHFYIHAVEASNEPGRALKGARLLAALPMEPAAAHLVHMPAHTFLRVGDWQAAIAANEHAVHHAIGFRQSNDPSAENACSHCLEFLSYAYSMQGHLASARRSAELYRDIEADPSNLVAVLARFRRFEELLAVPEPHPEKHDGGRDPHAIRGMWYYGQGLGHLGKGAADAAAADLKALRDEAALAPPAPVFPADRPDIAHLYDNITAALDSAQLSIATHELAGRLELARGRPDQAITELKTAVEVQEHAQYTEPPLWIYPVRETLAAVLAKTGATAEAELVLRECLKRTPHDPRALAGLERLLRGGGRRKEAAALAAEIAGAQARADVPLSFGEP